MSITSSTTPQDTAAPARKKFVTIEGLRTCGIFPEDHEPCIRTLRDWTYRRRIPSHRVGGFVYYDPDEVEHHIRTKLLVPARC